MWSADSESVDLVFTGHNYGSSQPLTKASTRCRAWIAKVHKTVAMKHLLKTDTYRSGLSRSMSICPPRIRMDYGCPKTHAPEATLRTHHTVVNRLSYEPFFERRRRYLSTPNYLKAIASYLGAYRHNWSSLGATWLFLGRFLQIRTLGTYMGS